MQIAFNVERRRTCVDARRVLSRIQETVPVEQRIAFVTSERVPEIHGDDRLVADALRRRGFQVTAAAWDDPAVGWRQFASVVIRATWDYHLDQTRYAAWLHRCQTERVNLWNPPAAVLANGARVGTACKHTRSPTSGCTARRLLASKCRCPQGKRHFEYR
jgi:hypothetical protein